MNLRELYRRYLDANDDRDPARRILSQRDWYASVAEFDPSTGEALPLGLSVVLRRINAYVPQHAPRDHLWRIIEHSRRSLARILSDLNESTRREQAMMPLRSVREVNASSLIALSRRPGRNIREKLADKPYMQAVRRYQSIDLPQNQLVKEFVIQLAELVEDRHDCFGQDESLLNDLHRWLRSQDCRAISRWDNHPPNNALLSHRDYGRVWDAWTWLRDLERHIDSDLNGVDTRAEAIRAWQHTARLYESGLLQCADMPVLFSYDSFTMAAWGRPAMRTVTKMLKTEHPSPQAGGPVCIDLSTIDPWFADSATPGAQRLRQNFVWQRWQRIGETVDLSLFHADAVHLHDQAVSISGADLLLPEAGDSAEASIAAHAFARHLRRMFTQSELLWLVPDLIHDFQLRVLRRAINAEFPHSQPLPRSVATVFAQVDPTAITHDGFRVLVVAATAGITYGTLLTARYDAELHRRSPESHGYFWERAPHVVLSHGAGVSPPVHAMAHVDQEGVWHDPEPVPGPPQVTAHASRDHPQVGYYNLLITDSSSPVSGGIQLARLQCKAGDIPLWRDQIPELAMGVKQHGIPRQFSLVSARTTVKPTRDVAVRIPVPEVFGLPAGQKSYTFPLYQGSAKSALGYVAMLTSPFFPLPSETACTLELTYTYGADDPYQLRFVPLDSSLPPVVASWRPEADQPPIDLDGLPIPPFPQAPSWLDLQHWPRQEPDPKTGRTESDLLDWVTRALDYLNPSASVQPSRRRDLIPTANSIMHLRKQGTFVRGSMDRNGRYFCFVDVDGRDVFCHSSRFLEPIDEGTLSQGEPLYLYVDDSDGRPRGLFITYTDWVTPALDDQLRRERQAALEGDRFPYRRAKEKIFSARYPTYAIWQHGRSVRDANCPGDFRRAVENGIAQALRLLADEEAPEDLKDELFFLLCRMHQDAPQQIQEQLTAAARERSTRGLDMSIAYALGRCSEPWQRDILSAILATGFPRRLRILSVALWRSPEPIGQVTKDHLSGLLPEMRRELETNSRSLHDPRSLRTVTTVLELLLALLRTRDSSDRDIKALLSPASDHGRAFTNLIDHVTRETAAQGLDLLTRVDLHVDKDAEYAKVPDLLFALRLYLTGDDGTDAIRIIGVRDE